MGPSDGTEWQMLPLQGWVNIEEDMQEHIKVVSPWYWPSFEMIYKTGRRSAIG
jgi:hypothetical protein